MDVVKLAGGRTPLDIGPVPLGWIAGRPQIRAHAEISRSKHQLTRAFKFHITWSPGPTVVVDIWAIVVVSVNEEVGILRCTLVASWKSLGRALVLAHAIAVLLGIIVELVVA